jgi:putative Mg2+ transporter-C (MgtC) family protein
MLAVIQAHVSTLEACARIGLALFLGAAIGVERQWRARMAGLRTNALVATGAALFVVISALTPGENSPTRIAAQVVTGVGFLGAGLIIRDGGHLRGINTAATIWCAAAVGALAGAGYPAEASIGAAVIVAANVLLRPVARRIDREPLSDDSEVQTSYHLHATCRDQDEPRIRALLIQSLSGGHFSLHSIRSEDQPDGRVRVSAHVSSTGRNDSHLEQSVARLSIEATVSSVEWHVAQEEVPDDSPFG